MRSIRQYTICHEQKFNINLHANAENHQWSMQWDTQVRIGCVDA